MPLACSACQQGQGPSTNFGELFTEGGVQSSQLWTDWYSYVLEGQLFPAQVAIAIVKWAQVLLVLWGQGYAQGLSHPACDSNRASIMDKQGVAAREGLHLHNFDNHVFGNALGAEPVSPTTNCQSCDQGVGFAPDFVQTFLGKPSQMTCLFPFLVWKMIELRCCFFHFVGLNASSEGP